MLLTLAHSPDPDDAFMWWPLTGKVLPDGARIQSEDALPRLETGPIQFRAIPADIEALNRRAAEIGDYDITALSFRAYCDVQDRYAITACGASFGDGFGPKVIAPHGVCARLDGNARDVLSDPALTIAVPGRRTTAFLLLAILIGPGAIAQRPERFIEMPFDRVIPAVASGEVGAGIVIHEGQILYEGAGLGLICDLGAWWKNETGLPVPLGCNAIRRDLDERFGDGTTSKVVGLLRESIAYALARREESVRYTLPFALANAAKKGADVARPPTLERIDRYISMYVNALTEDMGERGHEAVRTLLTRGHGLGLCPHPGLLDIR